MLQYTNALTGNGVALAVTHPVYVPAGIKQVLADIVVLRWEDSALVAELSKLLLLNVNASHFRLASVRFSLRQPSALAEITLSLLVVA